MNAEDNICKMRRNNFLDLRFLSNCGEIESDQNMYYSIYIEVFALFCDYKQVCLQRTRIIIHW